jgi:hypothetical protein
MLLQERESILSVENKVQPEELYIQEELPARKGLLSWRYRRKLLKISTALIPVLGKIRTGHFSDTSERNFVLNQLSRNNDCQM